VTEPAEPASTTPAPVPTLDRFVEASACGAGVNLLALEPLTVILVHTQNSIYRIVVANGCAVFVQGGRFFPRPTAARVVGATFGGSVLKLAWIGVGMQMEISGELGPIVTTPVQQIAIEPALARQVH
jgi:hypothetical protein